MPYDQHTHSHRFAVWAAATGSRVRQAGLGRGVARCEQALIAAGFGELPIFLATDLPPFAEFRAWHVGRCETIANELQVDFGRAAKLLNLYLKSRFLNLFDPEYEGKINAVHPPIDSRILKLFQQFPNYRWSVLNATEYANVIDEIRNYLDNDEREIFGPHPRPLWKIEALWYPAGAAPAP